MKHRSVSLRQLAEETGHNPSSIRRMVVSRGFVPFKFKEGSNKPWYLTSIDAESFKQQLEHERNNTIVPPGLKTKFSGVYFIEVPSYDGVIRVKIGWSDKLSDRFATYRTIIPDLRVKAIWPTSKEWHEHAALECAEKLGTRVQQELFEFEDSCSVLTELNELFSIFGIKNQHELEDHLNT